MLRSTTWSAPPSAGFGQETIKLRLSDRELERVAQRDSWETSDGGLVSLCPRGKRFQCFDTEGNTRWTSDIHGGDDVNHPVISRSTLYYFTYNGCNAVDLATGQQRYDRAQSIWRDVWPSRDGHLVSVEDGKLLVRDRNLKPIVEQKVPFLINRARHNQNARMVTLTFDDKRLDHAVMAEDGRLLFRSHKEVVFRGSELDDHLWQVLGDDKEGFEVLHITPEGKATTHPVSEPTLAVFGQPDGGFVTLSLLSDSLNLQHQDGRSWSLGPAKVGGLAACPGGGILITQEDGIRFYRDGQLQTLDTAPGLPAMLQDGSFLLVKPGGTEHIATDGTRTPYPDAWAAREALGGEVVSWRAHMVGMGLDEGTPPGWHNFLTDAERVAGPPQTVPGLGVRSTSTRLDFVRSKQANALARAGMRTALATDGTGVISAATLAIRNLKELDLVVAFAQPGGQVLAVNTWSAMASDQTPAAVQSLALDATGLLASDAQGNQLSIDFANSLTPLTERPEPDKVATLAARMLEYRYEARPATPAIMRLIGEFPELQPAARFVARIDTLFPEAASEAAKIALNKPRESEASWLQELAHGSHRQFFGTEWLRAVRTEDEVADAALTLCERSPECPQRLLDQAAFSPRPRLDGSPLDRRVQSLEWLTGALGSELGEQSARVLMEMLFDKADGPLDRKVLHQCAQRLADKERPVSTWWRETVADLKKFGRTRHELTALVSPTRATGIEEREGRLLVGGVSLPRKP